MSQFPQLNPGTLLRPQPGDLIVFTTDHPMSRQQAEAFAEVMQAQLPQVKALMLDRGIKLAEIHTNEQMTALRGQLLVLSTLLGEAIEVVKTIEAESTDEADKLRTLIRDSESARITIAREQLATWCTKVCSGEGCECERKENGHG